MQTLSHSRSEPKFLDKAEKTISTTSPLSRPIDPKKVRAAEGQTDVMAKIAGYEVARPSVAHAQTVLPLQHKLVKETTEGSIAQAKLATERKLDAATLALVRLEEEKVRTDVDRAKQLSELKVSETRQLEDVRLDGYKQEVGIDLNALLAQRLMAHETILGLKTRLRNLIIEREEIEALKVTQATKDRLLVEQDKIIIAFQENLRVQMERHLLESGDGQNVQGNLPPDDSAPSN